MKIPRLPDHFSVAAVVVVFVVFFIGPFLLPVASLFIGDILTIYIYIFYKRQQFVCGTGSWLVGRMRNPQQRLVSSLRAKKNPKLDQQQLLEPIAIAGNCHSRSRPPLLPTPIQLALHRVCRTMVERNDRPTDRLTD